VACDLWPAPGSLHDQSHRGLTGLVSRGVTDRLDQEKLETLRIWGAGLAGTGNAELQAAGKAILILVEEIEALQVDMWRALQESPSPPPAVVEREPDLDAAENLSALESGLRLRLRTLMRAPTPKAP
jgi:hypothetical protein